MGATTEDRQATAGIVLLTLAAGQFLMTLDCSIAVATLLPLSRHQAPHL